MNEHIATLILHGAMVTVNGTVIPLTEEIVTFAIRQCQKEKLSVICYDLFLPDVQESLLLAIYPDGHVDSGSIKAVIDCITSRAM